MAIGWRPKPEVSLIFAEVIKDYLPCQQSATTIHSATTKSRKGEKQIDALQFRLASSNPAIGQTIMAGIEHGTGTEFMGVTGGHVPPNFWAGGT